MKQSVYTNYHPYLGEVALAAAVEALITRATLTLHTWRQRVKQRNALAELSPRLLADAGISTAQRLVEVDKPFWRA